MNNHTDQSSEDPDYRSAILRSAAEFWAWYEGEREKAGETHAGAVLDGLRAEYHDILSREPIDINRVGSLTAEAALWLTGTRNF